MSETASAQLPDAPRPRVEIAPADSAQQPAQPPAAHGSSTINGTVTDTNGDLVQGATVALDGEWPGDHRELVTDDKGYFVFNGLKAGIAYHVSVIANGFSDWHSPDIVLDPEQFKILTGIILRIEASESSVTVNGSNEQIAVEQVRIEEQQRILGFIPNFYVVYDSQNAVPLSAKLKFKLAIRVSVDPVTLAGVLFVSGIDQAADRPDYVQGAKGYGQRIGSVYADNFSDILIGGAILPSLLHQDPRYFYQGTGSTRSRVRHALLSPFICKGDNGDWQPNYSTVGGDLASSAILNSYYPQQSRGAMLFFSTFAIGTGERLFSDVAQEFIFPRFMPKASRPRTDQ